jgi:hypothetical protein
MMRADAALAITPARSADDADDSRARVFHDASPAAAPLEEN